MPLRGGPEGKGRVTLKGTGEKAVGRAVEKACSAAGRACPLLIHRCVLSLCVLEKDGRGDALTKDGARKPRAAKAHLAPSRSPAPTAHPRKSLPNA